jgi:hypothetical protein
MAGVVTISAGEAVQGVALAASSTLVAAGATFDDHIAHRGWRERTLKAITLSVFEGLRAVMLLHRLALLRL